MTRVHAMVIATLYTPSQFRRQQSLKKFHGILKNAPQP